MMTDEWRYRCPRGHTSWHSRDSGYKDSQASYYCQTCQTSHGDGPFDELVDMKEPAPHHVDDPDITAVQP